MGCGCNKVRNFSQSEPLVIGEPNGDPSIEVRATVTVMGLRANSEFWVTGTGVAAMVEAGWLIAI